MTTLDIAGDTCDNMGGVALRALASLYGKTIHCLAPSRHHEGVSYAPGMAHADARSIIAAYSAMLFNAETEEGAIYRDALACKLPVYVVEPQRDLWDGTGSETCFVACDVSQATQWSLFLSTGPGATTLIEDYPSREAAEAARSAVEHGQALPAPIWPDETRAELEAMGLAIDGGGAGAGFMSRTIAHPGNPHRAAVVIVTDREGGDIPRAYSWRIGVYMQDEWERAGDALATLESVSGARLAESMGAALGMARILVMGGPR